MRWLPARNDGLISLSLLWCNLSCPRLTVVQGNSTCSWHPAFFSAVPVSCRLGKRLHILLSGDRYIVWENLLFYKYDVFNLRSATTLHIAKHLQLIELSLISSVCFACSASHLIDIYLPVICVYLLHRAILWCALWYTSLILFSACLSRCCIWRKRDTATKHMKNISFLCSWALVLNSLCNCLIIAVS